MSAGASQLFKDPAYVGLKASLAASSPQVLPPVEVLSSLQAFCNFSRGLPSLPASFPLPQLPVTPSLFNHAGAGNLLIQKENLLISIVAEKTVTESFTDLDTR